HGINIYGKNNALTTRATKTGTIQCYVGADGKLYAGAGAVILDRTGIHIRGEFLKVYDSGGTRRGTISGDSVSLVIAGYGAGARVKLVGKLTNTAGWESNVIPDLDDTRDLGSSSRSWRKLFINEIDLTAPNTGVYFEYAKHLQITRQDYITSPLERDFCHQAYGGQELSVYSNGAWRSNA
ncbi:unnamed protein product, partial [marine sediment metagenome]